MTLESFSATMRAVMVIGGIATVAIVARLGFLIREWWRFYRGR